MLSYGPPDDPDGDLLRLIGLGGLLPDRLAATVIAAWPAARDPAGAGPVALVGPRLLRRWVGPRLLRRWVGPRLLRRWVGPRLLRRWVGPRLLRRLRPVLVRRCLGPGLLRAGGPRPGAAARAARGAVRAGVTAALRSWTGRRDLPVALTMIPEDQPPRLARDGDGMAAELPFGWLSDVWARGLTTCWGRFGLAAAAQPSGDGWVLSTVALDLGPPRPVTLSSPPPSS